MTSDTYSTVLAAQKAAAREAESIAHAIEWDTGAVLSEWERGLIETTVKYVREIV